MDAPQVWSAALVAPSVTPVLDPLFRPAPLALHAFQARARASGHPARARVALEQPSGAVTRLDLDLVPPEDPLAPANARMVERALKLALWACGGCRVHIDAPRDLVSALRRHYEEDPIGRFDSAIVGESVYGRPIEIIEAVELPPARSVKGNSGAPLGGHLDGCRIGFDLGGSDRKVAAAIDGEVVYSEEIEWDPYHQRDPQYHWDGIMDSLRHAAARLPRVDAIGGSAAGVYVNNQVRFSSLFRGISKELFESRVRNLFLDIKRAWNDVPFEITNDGVVTALLGAMSTRERGGVLGVALGTSTAGGYVMAGGRITPWLDEIAFVPIDYRADAPVDEWSKDRGCLVQYLSQQAVGRLLAPANIHVASDMPLPKQLERLQALMVSDDARARDVYDTLGVYLGYAIGHLASVYDFTRVLVLGRVSTGAGGALMLERANEVLRADFPAMRVVLSMPNEKEKRHGQAIAAASLPALG